MILKTVILFFTVYLSFTSSILSQVNVGVALPLMSNSANSEEQKLGEQMLRGIKDALEEYKATDPKIDVNIKVEDTKKDQAVTLDIVNKFGSDNSIIGIIGPVYSSELSNNVGAGAFHKVPIITPTATQNFLAEKNDFIYQLNPTYDIRGRSMAKYAMNELGMKNFVVLSEDTYGKNFSDSFIDEVQKNNGSIVFIKYYSKDKSDLTEELTELKSKILEKEKFLDFGNLNKNQITKLKKQKLQFSYLDSLLWEKSVVSIYKLFGKDADKILDQIGISPISYNDKMENIILGNIDAIYIPIANFNEISKVAPQYFSEKINLPILGTSDWNNEKALNENKMYINQLYFDSDFYIKDKSFKSTDLSETDLRNYYFGYDGMKLILELIKSGNDTRLKLKDSLEKVIDFKTEHNNITIKNRTNHQSTIMIFSNGELRKVKDYIY